MKLRSSGATIGPSTTCNASNTPGSVATCHPRWPWTSRSVAPITEELTAPDRAAKHSRSSKGRPNPSAQLRTSCSADSAEQSHGRDESLPHFCETKPTRAVASACPKWEIQVAGWPRVHAAYDRDPDDSDAEFCPRGQSGRGTEC